MVDRQIAPLKPVKRKDRSPDGRTKEAKRQKSAESCRDKLVAELTSEFNNYLQELMNMARADHLNDISLTTVSLLIFKLRAPGEQQHLAADRLKQWKDIFDKIANNKVPEADALEDLMTRSGVTQELQPLLKSMFPVAAAVGNPIDYDRFITFCLFVEIFSTRKERECSSPSSSTPPQVERRNKALCTAGKNTRSLK